VLLDHCVPRPFARLLVGHEVRTSRQEGWQDLSNGVLLKTAVAKFDVFVTVDRTLRLSRR
jgi:tartrate dehydratase beta subunit/fumarate hydratase class I family protein